jgi:hypothetical protein
VTATALGIDVPPVRGTALAEWRAQTVSSCKGTRDGKKISPQHRKDFVAEHFSDGTLVSAVFMQEMTGGLADEGPALSNYAAAFLDETGELNLLEPCIPDDSALRAGPPH